MTCWFKAHPGASRKPSKRALQLAFHSGAVTISARAGMLETYEIVDRHFGMGQADRSPHRAADAGVILLDRASPRRDL